MVTLNHLEVTSVHPCRLVKFNVCGSNLFKVRTNLFLQCAYRILDSYSSHLTIQRKYEEIFRLAQWQTTVEELNVAYITELCSIYS